MTSAQIHSTGDSWKEIAARMRGMKAGAAAQRMIADMNDIYPFANASGVFDLGCGSGMIISHILETHGAEIPASATLLAGDYSTHMLKAVEEAKQANSKGDGDVWDRLKVQVMDAHDLSAISDASMSHVTGGHVYMLLENPRKALQETLRVLKPGGVLAMSTGKNSEHIDALEASFAKVKPGGSLNLFREPWCSEAGVKQELEAVGFVDVATVLVDSQVSYQTHKEFADALMVMPVMKNALEGLDEPQKEELRVRMVENLRGFNPEEPGHVKGVNIVAFARKST